VVFLAQEQRHPVWGRFYRALTNFDGLFRVEGNETLHNSEKGLHMKFKTLIPLLVAGLVTVLGVAGLAPGASTTAPSNQSPPTISGTPQEGSALTASTGQWNGTTPISYAYQWRRCDANGGSCADISGGVDKTYTLKSPDVGNTIRVRVTAKNADGSASATSVPTAVIKAKAAPPPTTVNGCPATGSGPIDVSVISLPAQLSIDGQSETPSPITRSTKDLTVKFHISACKGRPVSGALVYVTAIPFQQFTIPSEVPTDSSGWATLTMHQQSGFPASAHQQLLAMFVRARKPGEDVLAGIAARRLVSFPVHL